MDMHSTNGTSFPAIEDRQRLLRARKELGINNMLEADRWRYHAYDYGWRRVALDEKTPNSPIDPERKWFDAWLTDKAEAMWRNFFGKRAKVQKNQPPPTPEDIAYVQDVCRKVRANLSAWTENNKRAFGELKSMPTFVEDNADLEGLKRKLGLTATERKD